MSVLLRTAALALLAALPTAPAAAGVAEYRETFDTGESAKELLLPQLPVGVDRPWIGWLDEGGVYRLTNVADPTAVTYAHLLGDEPGALRNAAVSVDVGGRFGAGLSGAGLIYRLDPDAGTYWAFALTGERTYAVFRRDRSGLRRVIAGRSDRLRPGRGMNRLTVRAARGGGVAFLINGRQVATVASPDIQGAAVGLVALGTGSFRFDDFLVSTEGAPTAAAVSDGPETAALTPERCEAEIGTTAPTNGTAAGPAAVAYTSWTEPTEGAFELDVPRGWATVGGLVRLSELDARPYLRTTSPDGAVTVFIGDPDLPAFVLPSAALEAKGFPEGSWYAPFGAPVFVKRYTPGAAFAEEFVRWKQNGAIEALTVDEARDRPDLSQGIGAIHRRFAVAGTGTANRLDAGEIAYSGRAGDDGRPIRGYALAATALATAEGGTAAGPASGAWSVPYLYGFTAEATRAGEAAAVLARAVESFRLRRQWVRAQHGLTTDAARATHEATQRVADVVRDGLGRLRVSWGETERRAVSHPVVTVRDNGRSAAPHRGTLAWTRPITARAEPASVSCAAPDRRS